MSVSGKQPDGEEAAAKAVANAAVRTYEEYASRLAPVVGSHGFKVLFARSVTLVRREYPWLPDPAEQLDSDAPYAQLQDCFESRAPREARQAHRALLSTLYDLLRIMIGEVLTHRLLLSAPDYLDPKSPGDLQ